MSLILCFADQNICNQRKNNRNQVDQILILKWSNIYANTQLKSDRETEMVFQLLGASFTSPILG